MLKTIWPDVPLGLSMGLGLSIVISLVAGVVMGRLPPSLLAAPVLLASMILATVYGGAWIRRQDVSTSATSTSDDLSTSSADGWVVPNRNGGVH